MRKFLAVLTLSILPATLFGADKNTTATAPSACGLNQPHFSAAKGKLSPEVKPDAGTALVYVFSQLNDRGVTIGCQVTSRIGLDGKWVGANCGTSYLLTNVAPGEHHLCADWQTSFPGMHINPALHSLNAEAGKTYYFRARILLAEGISVINLDSVDQDEAKSLIQTYPASVSKPKS